MGYEYHIDGELTCDPPIPARDWMPPRNKWSHFAALDHHGKPDAKRGPWWTLFPVQDEDGSISTVKVRGWEKSTTWFDIIEHLVRDVALTKQFQADHRTVTGRLVATGEDGDEMIIAVTDNRVRVLHTDLDTLEQYQIADLIADLRADLAAARKQGTVTLPKGARLTIAHMTDHTGPNRLEIRLGGLKKDWGWQWHPASATGNNQRAFGTTALAQAIGDIEQVIKHRFDPVDADALKVVAPCPPDRCDD